MLISATGFWFIMSVMSFIAAIGIIIMLQINCIKMDDESLNDFVWNHELKMDCVFILIAILPAIIIRNLIFFVKREAKKINEKMEKKKLRNLD